MDIATLKARIANPEGSRSTLILGVLNVTPDSFSDGGLFLLPQAARARALQLVGEGADLLDVGGESTRPGALPVDADTEWSRIAPLFADLSGISVPISVDTYKSSVAERALLAGASVVNDISGGRLDPDLRRVCAEHDAVYIVSHLRHPPQVMHVHIAFEDVFEEVCAELAEALDAARSVGVRFLIADPGIGFGKSGQHNLELIARSGELAERLGVPVLIGPSRKAFLGALTGLPLAERLPATLGAVVAAMHAGADLVRVHDVAATRAALTVAEAIRGAGPMRRAGGR